MRFSRPPLMAVLLAAAFSAGNPAGAVPFSPLQVNRLPGQSMRRSKDEAPKMRAWSAIAQSPSATTSAWAAAQALAGRSLKVPAPCLVAIASSAALPYLATRALTALASTA